VTKKETFVNKTLKLFHKKGFKATTMRDISENMGFEVTNVYNYIENKQSFLQELLLDIANEFRTGLNNINNSSYDSIEKLKALISMHVRIASQKPYEVALLVDDFKNLEEPGLSEFKARKQEYQTIVMGIVKQGMEDGMIRPMNIEITTQTILSTLRWQYVWFAKYGTEKVNPVEMEKNIVEIILSGITTNK